MKIAETIKFADLFAGGGGVTTGALSIPGVHVTWALNHDPVSIQTHAVNHPETIHYQADIREQNEKELDQVDVLWASLECTNYSNAKGGLPRDGDSRTLAWELPRYALHCDPDYIIIENVREFLGWGPLDKNGKPVDRQKGADYWKWRQHMIKIGWPEVDHRILNAADFGCHTRRERLFIIFAKPGMEIKWKGLTHHPCENNLFGLPKWKPAKDCIDLENEGKSIFGRKRKLSPNTLKRIAGGVKRFAPDMTFIMKYYGTGVAGSNINHPLDTVRTKDCHALVTIEKMQFIEDHCWNDTLQSVDEPLSAQLTWQTKRLVTKEMKFISDGTFSGDHKNFSLDEPANTLTSQHRHQLISCKQQFLSETYNSNGKPEANNKSLDQPAGSITTNEKHQFITAYFNSGGNPESQNQDMDNPLNAVMPTNKHAMVTAIKSGLIDFDIKMRFLTPNELAKITGFPDGYFTRKELNIPKKQQVKMIGNAVPVELAAAVIEPLIEILRYEFREKIAV